MENKFLDLLSLNVNEKVEKKNGMNYLSWSFAWSEFCKVYPNASYKVLKDANMNCAFGNSEQGYMVYTEVTANGITHEMWLPVMDFKNKSMLAPTTFDINKAVMRCLVKNLAMFGLGLYIYSGEDLPEEAPKTKEEKAKEQENDLKEYNKKMDLAIKYLTEFAGNDVEKFEKVISHMNKTFKTEYKGFNQFKLEELESYIKALINKEKNKNKDLEKLANNTNEMEDK